MSAQARPASGRGPSAAGRCGRHGMMMMGERPRDFRGTMVRLLST